jgi:hypothetical protein
MDSKNFPKTLWEIPETWGEQYFTDDIECEVKAMNENLGWDVSPDDDGVFEHEFEAKIDATHALYRIMGVRDEIYSLVKISWDETDYLPHEYLPQRYIGETLVVAIVEAWELLTGIGHGSLDNALTIDDMD